MHRVRGTLAVVALVVVLAAVGLVTLSRHASPAASSDVLTVVGTSDVYDSNLFQTVIKPGFEKAYPNLTVNYVSQGTGAAIAYAEAGTASALIVHAAALENQFVAQGYSLERYGRAIFWGDFVLLGPTSDPAGVRSHDPHNIVGAFQRIAAAGAQGRATFVSRGGTPGTTVQEHKIWAMTHGVKTCTVSNASGGGTSPSTKSGACPTAISYPSWYHATGLTQAPNILNADACNYPDAHNSCYVLTDRGTYAYLKSTNALHDLRIVTRDNASTAPGGVSLLVNSFHAYAVNPSAFDSPAIADGINIAAAKDFLNWITSPPAQRAIDHYLYGADDPPFLPSAAPVITASVSRHSVTAGSPVTITGTLRNVVPGTPPLSNVPIQLRASSTSRPNTTSQLAVTHTDAHGHFAFTTTVPTSSFLSVHTDAITKIENPTLNPVFGDLLEPMSQAVGKVRVLPKSGT